MSPPLSPLTLIGLLLLLLSGAGAGASLGRRLTDKADNALLLSSLLLSFREQLPLPLSHSAKRLLGRARTEEGKRFLSRLSQGVPPGEALKELPLPEAVRSSAEALAPSLGERSSSSLKEALDGALAKEGSLPALAEAARARAFEDARLIPLLLPSLLLALFLLFI